MRGLAAFLFFCVALASATPVITKHTVKTADQTILQRQKHISELLYHVHQPNIHVEQIQISKSYSMESNLDKYMNATVVKEFMHRYRSYMLPKGMTFTPMYPTLKEEASLLFEVLYTAKDWQTFYSTACWAREHVNEQMFVYALSVAILHRPDCYGIVLPPPYEIMPFFYFTADVIDMAYKVKMQGHGKHISPAVHTLEDGVVVIEANYSNWHHNYNWEQKLTYFTEDVGLNTYYYNHHLSFPYWMDGEKYGLKKDGRGEIYYYLHQQLLARYYLERLSNGMAEIPNFSWMWPVETGYDPQLRYPNGIEMPHRPNHYDLKQGELLKHLINIEDYETRIREAIDLGYIIHDDNITKSTLLTPKSIEVLASIIQGNADNPHMRYFKHSPVIARMILGNSPLPTSWHKVEPSVLELFQTSLRDPVFYQMYKRYYGLFKQYKEMLPVYTEHELACPDVKIETVKVEKLVTYFDDFDSDITNALYQTPKEVEKKEDDVVVRVRQERLNHLPFTITMNLLSEKATKVSVRIFIGPKYNSMGDIIPIEANRENYFQLDHFVYDLVAGKNTLSRNSRHFHRTIPDWETSSVQWKHVLEAIEGKRQLEVDAEEDEHVERHSGFPQRLLLPRGRRAGMPHRVLVVVTPWSEPDVTTQVWKLDSMPLGFPLDRAIEHGELFDKLPNVHFETVNVYHKKEVEVNTTEH